MTRGARILVVDDEPQIRRSLEVSLQGHGYAVIAAENADEAWQRFTDRRPDVLLVDVLLPGMSGLDLARRVRERSAVPIIMLSAVGTEAKKVEALEDGADDYVTKPFSTAELVARIKSVLRRAAGAHEPEPVYTVGELSVNFALREVCLRGEAVPLTPTEYDLLKYMIEHSGRVLTHRMLLTAVWGQSFADEAQYLRVFIGRLRKKLESDPARPRYILTDPRVGYRFVSDPAN